MWICESEQVLYPETQADEMGLQNSLVFSQFLSSLSVPCPIVDTFCQVIFHDFYLYVPNCPFVFPPHPDDNMLLLKLLCVIDSFPHRLFIWSFLLRFSAGSRITLTV